MISKDNKLNLDKTLFWDTNFETLDADVNSQEIIERVLIKGGLDDWYAIRNYYNIRRIKNVAIQIDDMDPFSLHFYSSILETPIKKFKAYHTSINDPDYKIRYSKFLNRGKDETDMVREMLENKNYPNLI